MDIEYDSIQDLTLRLTSKENDALLRGPTPNFRNIPRRPRAPGNKAPTLLEGYCEELQAHVFLGFSRDEHGIFSKATEFKMGKIIIPNIDEQGYPWMINLSQRGVEHYKAGWQYGVRYDGEHKLFIARVE